MKVKKEEITPAPNSPKEVSTSSIIQELNTMNQQQQQGSTTSGKLHHRPTTTTTTTTSSSYASTTATTAAEMRQSHLPRKRLFVKAGTTSKSKKSLSFFIICFCACILFVAMISLPTFLALDGSIDVSSSTSTSSTSSNTSNSDHGSNNEKSAITVTTKSSSLTQQRLPQLSKSNTTATNNKTTKSKFNNKNKLNLKSCSFRTYKPNRYYKVDSTEKEDFLSKAEYIRGEYPFILNPRSQFNADIHNEDPLLLNPKKLCLDTSAWEDVKDGYWPFSDGQNPSVISLKSNVYNLPQSNSNNNHSEYKDRIDSMHLQPLKEIYNNNLEDLYLGLLLFGDSQCRWNLTPTELEEKKFSPLDAPPQKRSMVVIFDEEMNAINSSVLHLVLDANWGEKRKKLKMAKNSSDGSYVKKIVELDDARIFFYNRQLHVLYRNGPLFGYESQLQNPIHIKKTGNDTFEAYIKASESFKVCCGRNIAFISEVPTPVDHGVQVKELRALTWIDPVTTVIVKSANNDKSAISRRRQLLSLEDADVPIRRFLKEKKKKSHIHGTNGYMLPFHSTSEVFGIAHFHRPEGRQTSDYARHGHHYTHAFFTLQYSSTKGEYFLKRLSNEFIFMAPSSPDDNTGDVIQFTSGLDLIGSDIDGKLMISYGINDCEAATFFISMERVQEMLVEVNEGEEVVNLMAKVKE